MADIDDLKNQLSNLWRSVTDGLDSVRDAVVRSSQAGWAQIDIALRQQERADLYKQLGELTCAFLDGGATAPTEEMVALRGKIRDLDEKIRAEEEKIKVANAAAKAEEKAAEGEKREEGVDKPAGDVLKDSTSTENKPAEK